MKFNDPALLEGWLSPHSLDWYSQLGAQSGVYNYERQSKIDEPNGETLFDGKVLGAVKDKKVLDVGCGHGEFTIRCSYEASEITGFDVTYQFLKTGETAGIGNMAFVLGRLESDAFPLSG